MKSRKCRRESGRVYNKNYDPENGEYYRVEWDDWIDHRDGFRNLRDPTLKRPNVLSKGHWGMYENSEKVNKKIKKLLKRKEVMRNSKKRKT